MKLSRGHLTGVQTGTRLTDIVHRLTLLSTRHSAQNTPSKGLFYNFSPVQATILPMAKQPLLPQLLSTNTLALLWILSPIWPCLPQGPPNFLDRLRYNQEGE